MVVLTFLFLYTTVPSAPPTFVKLTVNSSTSVNVTWGEPADCRDWNGEITGYSVRYGEEGSGEGDRTVQMTSEIATTISGLNKETVYNVEMAAVTSAGTGVYSHPLTIETPNSEHSSHVIYLSPLSCIMHTDAYFSLNGSIIPNHGYVDISDIGVTDGTALLCHTNRQQQGESNGNWFAPNGNRVNFDDVKGFTRNRAPRAVRLIRTTGPSPEGMYWCSILDAAGTPQTIFVGLYNHGRGM